MITLSRPSAYGEYEPYEIMENKEKFQLKTAHPESLQTFGRAVFENVVKMPEIDIWIPLIKRKKYADIFLNMLCGK